MRTFVSAVAVIVGLLLAAVAIPAMWVDRNIVQEDGFVSLAAPLGKDTVFQERLASAAVATLDAGGQVPEPVKSLVQPILDKAAKSLTSLPGYPAAWEETLRKSHRLNFADSGSGGQTGERPTALTLDVAPLVGLLAKQISDATQVPLQAPGQALITIGQPSQRDVIERVSLYAPTGYALAAGAAVAFGIGFITARRRWAVLVGTGIGALILSAVWKLCADAAAGLATGLASGNQVADLFKNEFIAASSERFGQWILVAVITGVLLLVAGVLTRVLTGRRPA
ncbi:hypothetical protein [Arthrobacter sp. 92]|uniref:hypothetical protein n=1 Tax=Arthrobacter sp. 92 TaxID=3418175 RepID=UPI0006A8E0B5|nr:hypothetical protein AHiyo6_33030 [Arthrobacter sp. Hiyo6]